MALDVADEKPEGMIFIVPARLEACKLPTRLQKWQYVDLFTPTGYRRLLDALIQRSKDLEATGIKFKNSQTINFKEEDSRTEWLVYQVAFLWHGFAPPSQKDHWDLMTRDIEDTKNMLHLAIDAGQLPITRQITGHGGFSRFVSRADLIIFATNLGIYPSFLFPSQR